MSKLGGLIGLLLMAACTSPRWRAQFVPQERAYVTSVPKPKGNSEPRCETRDCTYAPSLDKDAPYLKCHLQNGEVLVLEHWNINRELSKVQGQGLAYNTDRVVVRSGPLEANIADVVLFETNRPEQVSHSGVAVMVVVTGASVALSVACLTNPKACFGSCPTFYAATNDGYVLQAEGFSHSIAKRLESTDIDPMPLARSKDGKTLRVWVTNEAPETHAIRSVELLTVQG